MTTPDPSVTRRRPLATAAAALVYALAVAACSDAPAPAAPRARNVVVILADDLGYADVSTYGSSRIPTPNIDRIARDGVAFTDGYVTAANCSPSRAGLLTGRYPQRFGFEYNAGGNQRAHDEHLGIAVGERTLGDLLRGAGLRTALIGKWHQGSQDEFYPTNRGFDDFFGFLVGQTAYVDPDVPGIVNAEVAEGGGLLLPRSAYRELGQVIRGPERVVADDAREYLTEVLTREAVAYIDDNQDRPFLLYLAYNAPHLPFQVPQEYYDRFPQITDEKLRVYTAMVSALDDGVGRVLDDFERLGLADDTLVVFLSDNGCTPYAGVCEICTPARGGKFTYFEGGVRVPFVMRWPAGLPAGRVFSNPVSALDVVPTALAAVGAALPTDRTYDGVDLLPYLRDERTTPPHERLFWRADPLVAMREGAWKTWRSRDGEFSYLFDLSHDPSEADNLVAREPERLEALDQTYAAWEAQMGPPAWDARLVPVPSCGEDFLLPF